MRWQQRVFYRLLAVAAGAFFVLGLAPWQFWPAIPVSAGVLLWLLHRPALPAGFITGWLYGIGFFGAGASWVYVSINVHGHAAPPLAALLTLIFCAGLAVLFGVQGWLYTRFMARGRYAASLAFPALWVLFEGLRGWLLTGFPWLYAGYGAIDTPLASWAPVSGVFGLSLALVMLGSLPMAAYMQTHKRRYILLSWVALIAILAIGGRGFVAHDWTQAHSESLSVAIYQPDIPLERKWDPREFRKILRQYRTATDPLYAQADLIIWPESALPALKERIASYLNDIAQQASAHNSTLITGIPSRDKTGFHNSIMALGNGGGIYHKQKLVPFGEYVPLEQWLRGLIQFFDLPMSNFVAGSDTQSMLRAGDYRVASFICYEVVYPDFVASNTQHADFLVTISNDSWFGRSIGPLQHLQMARFRALETGRDMLRGTNNGVSAIIDHRGNLRVQGAQFVETTLFGDIQPRTGSTPFMLTGSWPVWILCVIFLVISLRKARR